MLSIHKRNVTHYFNSIIFKSSYFQISNFTISLNFATMWQIVKKDFTQFYASITGFMAVGIFLL
ncbi:MAG: hypothetical protein ACOVOV_06110, partial [Dolichospermum sp.]